MDHGKNMTIIKKNIYVLISDIKKKVRMKNLHTETYRNIQKQKAKLSSVCCDYF